MSVGANSIKRAAKTAAAEGPRENGPEAKTPERAEGGAKAAQTSRKAVQKKRYRKHFLLRGKNGRIRISCFWTLRCRARTAWSWPGGCIGWAIR